MRTLITFDITDDRKRYRVVKILMEYSQRVQKSVFESPSLSKNCFLRMRSHIERLIDPKTDSVRYYRLCNACEKRIRHYGAGPGTLDPPESVEVIGD